MPDHSDWRHRQRRSKAGRVKLIKKGGGDVCAEEVDVFLIIVISQ